MTGDPTTHVVERAEPDDAAAIARLEERALGRDAWSVGLVEDGVSGRLPTVHYLVVRDGPAVVGYAVVSVAADIAELQRIAVDPGRRRTGAASALLAAAVAGSGDAERMLLEVREDNEGARAFYESRGFVELDRRPRYYRDGAAAVVMVLPLTGPDRNVWATA